jgi:gluconolactonase
MAGVREIASGLQFPEGPVALSDGSVVVVEIKGGAVTRVGPDGSVDVVARTGGGPNGAAVGPDGKLYVANNGGSFDWVEDEGVTIPRQPPVRHEGGRIERVDLETGEVEVLYNECDGRPLRGPNDLVFDREGGFYVTDHGIREERTSDRTGVTRARSVHWPRRSSKNDTAACAAYERPTTPCSPGYSAALHARGGSS